MYPWKVAQGKDAQETRLAARAVSDNNQFPTSQSPVSHVLPCRVPPNAPRDHGSSVASHPVPPPYLRMTFEEFALAMADDEGRGQVGLEWGRAMDPAVPGGGGGPLSDGLDPWIGSGGRAIRGRLDAEMRTTTSTSGRNVSPWRREKGAQQIQSRMVVASVDSVRIDCSGSRGSAVGFLGGGRSARQTRLRSRNKVATVRTANSGR